MSPSEIVRIVKNITAREIYRRRLKVKTMLWGGNIWTSGYCINTVGKYGTEEVKV
jgi:REP element-mobilizing transposase RayT